MSDEETLEQTKYIIQLRDQIQSYLLAWGAGDRTLQKNFGLKDWEFQMLVRAYKTTVSRLGRIPAWFEIVVAEAMVMGPRIMQLLDYRKARAEADYYKSRAMAAEARAEYAEAQAQNPAAPIRRERRRDGKRMWTVDKQGRFIYNEKGEYIQEAKRIQRPLMEDWDLLSKHNDSETLKAAFGK